MLPESRVKGVRDLNLDDVVVLVVQLGTQLSVLEVDQEGVLLVLQGNTLVIYVGLIKVFLSIYH